MSNQKKATESELNDLHGVLAKVLKEEVQRIIIDKDGNAGRNASMINVARQFLKDNKIEALAEHSPELKNLVDALPFDDEAETIGVRPH